MKLSSKMRVLSISHWDLDGCGCQIVLANYFDNITFRSCTFNNIDTALLHTPYDQYDVVFVTDIYPKSEESIVCPEKTVILDHHDSAQHLHDPAKNRLVDNSHCATHLVKRYIETKTKRNLTYLKSLVYLINDYDCWIHNNPKSRMLNELYGRYRENRFRKRFMQGHTRFTTEEITFIQQRIREFRQEWDKLELFDLPVSNGCLFVSSEFINDLGDRLLREEGYKLIFMINPKSHHISVRHKIEGLHIGHLLQDLQIGGGHENAGGISDTGEDTWQDQRDKITIVEREICDRFPEAKISYEART